MMGKKSLNQLIKKLVLGLILFTATTPANAEVIIDRSFSAGATLDGPEYQIEADFGRQMGSNLFHSFAKFNIYAGETATFLGNDQPIANIISRVTGNGVSDIQGTLASDIEGANLYLLNPQGIQFGEHATLNLSGSFYASTADYLTFNANGETVHFYVDRRLKSTFTSADPTAFGFLNDTPAPITVNNSLLQVLPKEELALIGGELTLNDSSLFAAAGQISLIAVGSEGEFMIENADVSRFSVLSDIQLQGRHASEINGTLDVSDVKEAQGAGKIILQGGEINLNRATVFSKNNSELTAQGVDIHAERLTLRNDSRIEASNENATAGRGGAIKLTVKKALEIDNHSVIATNNQAEFGIAGTIEIDAETVLLSNDAQLESTNSGARGQSGAITVSANDIQIRRNSTLQADSEHLTGEIRLNASNEIELLNGGVITAMACGGAAQISIQARSLVVENDSKISTVSAQAGGGITIQVAERVILEDDSEIRTAFKTDGIQSEAGTINIQAQFVIVDNSSVIVDANAGNTGDIRASQRFVDANDTQMDQVSKGHLKDDDEELEENEQLKNLIIMNQSARKIQQVKDLCELSKRDTDSYFNSRAGRGGGLTTPNLIVPTSF